MDDDNPEKLIIVIFFKKCKGDKFKYKVMSMVDSDIMHSAVYLMDDNKLAHMTYNGPRNFDVNLADILTTDILLPGNNRTNRECEYVCLSIPSKKYTDMFDQIEHDVSGGDIEYPRKSVAGNIKGGISSYVLNMFSGCTAFTNDATGSKELISGESMNCAQYIWSTFVNCHLYENDAIVSTNRQLLNKIRKGSKYRSASFNSMSALLNHINNHKPSPTSNSPPGDTMDYSFQAIDIED